MKKIILFDMDGTLTPPRKKMDWEMTAVLSDIQKAGFEIGVVTGSDWDYLKDQMDIVFDLSGVDFGQIHWLPCNGTKYYKHFDGKFNLIDSSDMISHIGKESYRKLIDFCFKLQSNFIDEYKEIITGKFFSYRGSILNWCPIGRDSNFEERNKFNKFDIENNWRSDTLQMLNSYLKIADIKNVTIKLGGETSFDIFPKGWDKTFCLKNFKDYEKIYFIGDRCFEGGNDKEIYEKCQPNSYVTSGPSNTIGIVKKILE